MMPANPISDTTKPKPWQAVTDMMEMSAHTNSEDKKDRQVLRAPSVGMAFSQRLVHTSQMDRVMEGGLTSATWAGLASLST